MNKLIMVYLATPYYLKVKSKEIGENKPDYYELDMKTRAERFVAVNEVALKLMKAGFGVISPISQSHPIATQCDVGGTFDFWEELDYNLILRCDMVMVYRQEGWERSEGVRKEVDFAKQNGIPVFYIDSELRLLEA